MQKSAYVKFLLLTIKSVKPLQLERFLFAPKLPERGHLILPLSIVSGAES